MSNERPKKKSLLSLWLLIALCMAPVVASYIAYYLWQPSAHVNYGELLKPAPPPDAKLALADGAPFQWGKLKGKWVLVMVDSGSCDAYCQRKLLYLRQVRLAQGGETERIERAWLIIDDAKLAAATVDAYQGSWFIRAGSNDVVKHFPARRSPIDHIYVIDPLGNLMMRYPRDADPRNMVKDVARLLRHSKWK